jgi:hypothetical protein
LELRSWVVRQKSLADRLHYSPLTGQSSTDKKYPANAVDGSGATNPQLADSGPRDPRREGGNPLPWSCVGAMVVEITVSNSSLLACRSAWPGSPG